MIGRIEEKRQLQQLLSADEAQFVAVFGRRRIGKMRDFPRIGH